MAVTPPAPRAIALAGPTASGKTALSLAIAREWDSEVVSVDSALVYRGMDIGTAKPSHEERALVPHHLIDIRDPRDAYSAAEFASDAARLIAGINARGRIALLVGGTMLYFKALFEGLDAMPPAQPEIRAQIESEAAQRGWPAMHDELARGDVLTAARVAPNDSQRIQRALEVLRSTGRAISSFHGDKRGGHAGIPLFALEPQDRAWLHERIALRFDAMLAAGFIDEVTALRARGDLDASMPSMRAVGYRQAWGALDGAFPLSELRDRGVFATRQLAKRQLTWLRGMKDRIVIACDSPDAQSSLMRHVREVV
ncbi:MAG TPA: tRNA (adenosine(37)-N6)-dimethylallyltransferase MiaA [Ramlibacter sp.]|nr:tRNA (adenosine(37)-N6)-dimethylallyltransferase MiaA [Ramlibacter sp.]